MEFESNNYYSLWLKCFNESESLSECITKFKSSLKEAAVQGGDVTKIDPSLPNYIYQNQGLAQDAWKQHDISCFFRTADTNYEDYKNVDENELKSVDDVMNIYLEI